MNWWMRLRLWFGRLVLKGTGCVPVRRAEIEEVEKLSQQLLLYADSSGGLNDPRRIRARDKIMAYASLLNVRAERLEVE